MTLFAKQRSGLPPWPSHFIRFIQFCTSIVVIAIISWLHEEISHKHEPSVGRDVIQTLETMWGWRLIFVASVLTSTAAIVCTILHILRRLSSWLNLVLNLLFLVLWSVAFYGLWKCTVHHNVLTLCDETSPCQVYNAVFACVCLALTVTSIAAILDLEVLMRRRQTKYRYLYSPRASEVIDAESFLGSSTEMDSLKKPEPSKRPLAATSSTIPIIKAPISPEKTSFEPYTPRPSII